jgi:hypothetical protein
MVCLAVMHRTQADRVIDAVFAALAQRRDMVDLAVLDVSATVQRAYAECAEGYGFKIDPCPPHDPQKKGIVESGVKYLKGNFLPLRSFRDLADLNAQARAWVMEEAGVRYHGTTRRTPLALFDLEAPLLQALPSQAPDLGSWHRVNVHRDCHVQFERVLYSAPFALVGKTLWLRATDAAVALFEDYRHVATHDRRIGAIDPDDQGVGPGCIDQGHGQREVAGSTQVLWHGDATDRAGAGRHGTKAAESEVDQAAGAGSGLVSAARWRERCIRRGIGAAGEVHGFVCDAGGAVGLLGTGSGGGHRSGRAAAGVDGHGLDQQGAAAAGLGRAAQGADGSVVEKLCLFTEPPAGGSCVWDGIKRGDFRTAELGN